MGQDLVHKTMGESKCTIRPKYNAQYLYNRAIIGPPAKRHLNGVSLAC